MPAKWQQWFPFRIDAFKSSPAVRAMHPSARAGYLYLLGCAWQTEDCTIPNDPLTLAEMSELGDELWALHGNRILRKFESVTDGKLRNAPLYADWLAARKVFDSRREAANRTNQDRWATSNSSVTDTVGDRRPNRSADTHTGTRTVQEQKNVSDAKASSPRLVDGARAHIEAIYALYPRKEGKGAAIKAIAKSLSRLRKGESPLQPMSPMEAKDHLAKRCKLYASSPIVISLDRDKIPHPATWFNQSRYLDDEFEWGFNGKLNRQQQQGLDDFRARMKSRSTPKQVGYVEPSEADRIARHINATYGKFGITSVDEMVESAVADGLFSDSDVSPDLVIDIISEWRKIEVMAGREPAIMPKAVNG